jgi:hypothetical protein
MNRTGWGSRNTNVLVKLTHVLHMAELWDNIARSYKMVARLLDPESNICACATDIENNDVLNYLHFLAFKLRYPGITSGNDTITERCECIGYLVSKEFLLVVLAINKAFIRAISIFKCP